METLKNHTTEAEAFSQLELSSVRTADYERNSQRAGADEICIICGRRLNEKNREWVHLLTNGNLVASREDFGKSDQGFFGIGPECKKRLPKGFIFPTL